MAIEIEERFQVEAPIDAVWRFMLDPEKVAACMPGAKLEEVVDDKTFLGSIKLKFGAVTTSYKGRVHLTEVDEGSRKAEMTAEGRETGGGTARATVTNSLRELPDGQVEILSVASVEVTGRIVQVGRGMIQGVSHQLFRQFAARVEKQLTEARGGAGEPATGEAAVATSGAADDEAISVLPVFFRALASAIANFFRRLLGRPPR